MKRRESICTCSLEFGHNSDFFTEGSYYIMDGKELFFCDEVESYEEAKNVYIPDALECGAEDPWIAVADKEEMDPVTEECFCYLYPSKDYLYEN